jgi:cysteine desulfurase
MPYAGPCYLDNSATTRPFDEVIEAMSASMAEAYYNPSAAYSAGIAVEDEIEGVRVRLLAALGGEGRLVFTSGGTEADNLAILGTAGDRRTRVVTTAVEHPAAAMAFEELKARGHDVVVLPVDAYGQVSSEALAGAVDENTSLVSIMHVNNETGAIEDIAALAAAAKRKNPSVLFHSDGVQAFLRVPAELGSWGIDLYSVSAHKVHGPKGVGALYVSKGARLCPVVFGGGQEGGMRSGTQNVPGIIGFGKAVEVFSRKLDKRLALMMELKRKLAMWLAEETGGIAVNGPWPEQGAPHILNVSFEGVQGEVLLRALSEKGVYVSTGSACGARQRKPSAVLKAMGLSDSRIGSAIRLSLSPLNDLDDVLRAVEEISAQVNRLRPFKRR